MKKVELLLKNFTIHSYDGSSENNCPIENALSIKKDLNHSSAYGSDCTLVLKGTKPFKLSHFGIGCSKIFQSQLRTGILIVSDEPLDEEYLVDFKGPYANAYGQVARSDLKQALVFETEKDTCELEVEILDEGFKSWWTGSYLTIKFLDGWGGSNKSIIIGTIGPIGTLDLGMKESKLGPIAHTFNVKKVDI